MSKARGTSSDKKAGPVAVPEMIPVENLHGNEIPYPSTSSSNTASAQKMVNDPTGTVHVGGSAPETFKGAEPLPFVPFGFAGSKEEQFGGDKLGCQPMSSYAAPEDPNGVAVKHRNSDAIKESQTEDTDRISGQGSDDIVGSDRCRSEDDQEEGLADEGQGASTLPTAYAVDDGEIPVIVGTSIDGKDEEKKLKEKKRKCIVLSTLLTLLIFLIIGLSIGLTNSRAADNTAQSAPELGPSPSPTPGPLTNCPPEYPAMTQILPSEEETYTYCSNSSADANSTTNNTSKTLGDFANNSTSETCWTRVGPLLDGDPDAKFGVRANLDASGSRFAVCAIKEGSCNGNKLGVVYIYDIKNDLAFIPVGRSIEGLPGDQSYARLSDDGRRLALGFHKRDEGGFQVYELNATSKDWILVGEPIIGTPGDEEFEESYFGYIMSMNYNGSVIAVGAPRVRNGIGSVFVFRLTQNGFWGQMGEEIVAPNAIRGDRFGYALSLSADGSILAVGQQSDHDLQGRVVVYQFKDESWNMLGQQIIGERVDDKFGKHVRLSSDGRTLIAAAKDHANEAGTGLVRIFRFNETTETWARLGSKPIESKSIEFKPSRVDITADGNRIAMATGKATFGQGYAEVYDYDGKEWLRVGGKIPAPEQIDEYGGSISISNDGSRLLLSYATESRGVVQIYQLKEKRS